MTRHLLAENCLTWDFILNKKTAYILSTAVIVLIWILCACKIDSDLILPFPSSVFQKAVELLSQKKFLMSLLKTADRCFASFALSMISGIFFGFLSSESKTTESFFEFPLAIIKSTPVAAFILIAIFWTSSDSIPILSAMLMAFPIIYTSVLQGLSSPDRNLLKTCRIFHLTFFQTLLFCKIPCAKKIAFSGFKNAYGTIWKVVVAAEILCLPQKALGSYLQNAEVMLETKEVFAVTLILVISGFVSSKIIFLMLELASSSCKKIASFYFKFNLRQYNKFPTMQNDITVSDLCIKKDDCMIFDGFSAKFKKERTTAILAPSGRGKTTLLDYIFQTEKDISYCTQDVSLFPYLSARQNIELPLINFYNKDERKKIVDEYIEIASLEDKKDVNAEKLSGGQKQRIAVSRAFAFPSKTILLDEPFKSIDEKAKKHLMKKLWDKISEEKKTVIFSTHNEDECPDFADDIIHF